MTGHAARKAKAREVCTGSALNPTKSRRRDRKAETLNWFSKALTIGAHPLEVPTKWQGITGGYKLAAAILGERRDFFLWVGRKKIREDDDRHSDGRILLERAASLLLFDRLGASKSERSRIDELWVRIRTELDKAEPTVWHCAEQRHITDPSLQELRRKLSHEAWSLDYLARARAQLLAEQEETDRRGQQLAKELAEGQGAQTSDAKLRDLVRSARDRGDLPGVDAAGPE